MQNRDEATIFGSYTGRLHGETVDVIPEQVKYRFKLCLLHVGTVEMRKILDQASE
jgi:hypothetical protein